MLVHQNAQNKRHGIHPKSITPKYLDAKSKGFSKLNKSKENASKRHT
jgi:hypothetical protein